MRFKDGRRKQFWWAPNQLIDEGHISRMGANAFAVYCVMLRSADENSDRCFPSLSYLGEKTGLARATVNKAVKTLINLEYIVKVVEGDRSHHANVYEVQNCPELVHEVNQSEFNPRTSSSRELVQSRTRTSSRGELELVHEVNSKKTNRRKLIEQDSFSLRGASEKNASLIEELEPEQAESICFAVHQSTDFATEQQAVEDRYSAAKNFEERFLERTTVPIWRTANGPNGWNEEILQEYVRRADEKFSRKHDRSDAVAFFVNCESRHRQGDEGAIEKAQAVAEELQQRIQQRQERQQEVATAISAVSIPQEQSPPAEEYTAEEIEAARRQARQKLQEFLSNGSGL